MKESIRERETGGAEKACVCVRTHTLCVCVDTHTHTRQKKIKK